MVFQIKSVTKLKFSVKLGDVQELSFVVVGKLVVLFKIEVVHTQKSCNLSKYHPFEYQCYTSEGNFSVFFSAKTNTSSFSCNLSKQHIGISQDPYIQYI